MAKKMDPKLVAKNQRYEVRDLAKLLGVTQKEVREAIDIVGRGRKALKAYFKK